MKIAMKIKKDLKTIKKENRKTNEEYAELTDDALGEVVGGLDLSYSVMKTFGTQNNVIESILKEIDASVQEIGDDPDDFSKGFRSIIS